MAVTDVRLRYLVRIKARGHEYWYFRHGGLMSRLPGKPDETAFLAAYHNCLTGVTPKPKGPEAGPGTLAALIDAYKASPEWRGLAEATRRDYGKFLPTFREKAGETLVTAIDRAWVFRLRDRYANEVSNRTANKAVTVASILLTWAMDHGWRPDNPALRPKRLKVTGGGYRAWTDAEIEAFLAKAPAHVALACLLGLGTGQRAQDLVRMTFAAYRRGEIEVTQEKTGERVWIPVHGRLKAALDAETRTVGTILVSTSGRPYTSGNLSHDVRAAVVEAGLPDGLVMHGWRTTALTWMAEAGCTPAQIGAISGHQTTQMIEHYTRDANRKTLARAAVVKLRRRR